MSRRLSVRERRHPDGCSGQVHFDFDCGGPGWRAYDLGVFLWSLTINGHGDDVWRPFVHGYLATRPLSDHDLAAAPVFAAIRVVWLLDLWCANAHVVGYARLHDDYLDRELARAHTFLAAARRPQNEPEKR